MEYSAPADHPEQGYHPSTQAQQYYNQYAEGYYSNTYPNPQYLSNPPYPYQAVNVQPSEGVQQEPTPPGITLQPTPQQYPTAYYQSVDYGSADYAAAAAAGGYTSASQHAGGYTSVPQHVGGYTAGSQHAVGYTAGPQHAGGYTSGPQYGGVDAGGYTSGPQYGGVDAGGYTSGPQHGGVDAGGYTSGLQHGGVDAGIAMSHQQAVHQPIVQHPYVDPGTISNTGLPSEPAQTHPSLISNFTTPPHRGRGRGRGPGQGRGRGRGGRGRGRGQALHKQGPAHVKSGPQHPPQGSQPHPPVPFPGQPQHPGPSAPGSRPLWCELCQVGCNSIDILKLHLSGKKHMKKFMSIQASQNPNSLTMGMQIEQAYVPPNVPQINPMEASANQQPHQVSLSFPPQPISHRRAEEVKKLPFSCEVCKIGCDTQEILNKHLNGKKHQKNSKTPGWLHNAGKRQIGAAQMELPENQLPSQNNKTEVGDPTNQESKIIAEAGKNVATDDSKNVRGGLKRKMRGGRIGPITKRRPLEPPRPKENNIPLVCELCNVTSGSQVDFQSHLAGKKHIFNAKRFLSENKTLGQEVFQILKHTIQSLHEQNAMASTSVASQPNPQALLAQPMNMEGASDQPLFPAANFGGPFAASAMGTLGDGHAEGETRVIVANDASNPVMNGTN